MSHKPTAKQTPVAAAILAQPQKQTAAIPSFDTLSDSAFIRESHLVQSPKRPDRATPLPFSAPTLWRKVKNQTFPAPVKLSERITAWKVADVRAWINAQTLAG